jgi:hypothetical protein
VAAHKKSEPEFYSEEEANRRFVAALKGASLAGSKPMKKKPKKAKPKKIPRKDTV